MASTYVNDLRLNEMATGDASGTWGEVTNTNLELIAEAFSYGTEAITTNADTHTTTIADGATDPGRSLYLKYTGTLDSACTITIGPNTVSKMWFIENATTGSQNIIISQGSGANVTIPAGETKVVYSDGAGSGAAVVDAFANLKVSDAAQTNITSVGALDGGSITSGFGSIDVGSSAITTTGTVTGNTLAGTLSTAAQPNITSVGTLTGFTSTGIDDNASSTTITIDASNRVNIGKASSVSGKPLEVQANTSGQSLGLYGRASDGLSYLGFFANGANTEYVSLRADNTSSLSVKTGGSERLNVNSTGIDVTGTVVADNAEIGTGGASNANAIVDLTGDTTYTDFGFRIIRNSGANGNTDLRHRGTGNLNIEAVEAGNIVFETSDTERARIDSSGNVGIGTSSPDTLLTVGDFGDTARAATFHGGNILIDGGAASEIIIGDGNVAYMSIQTTDNATAMNIRNFSGSSDLVTIERATGNVGIGTTSPAQLLEVSGNGGKSRFTRSGSNGTTMEFYSGASAAGGIQVQSTGLGISGGTGENHVFIDTSGNVGIGNTSPSSYSSSSDNLVVGTSGDTGITIVSGTASNGQLKFADGTSGDATGRGIIDYNHAADSMALKTAATERMRIDSNGNIAIGGTSASNFSGYVTLDLRDTTGGLIDFSEASAGVFARIQAVVNNSLNINNRQAYPVTFGTNDTERMRITSNGFTKHSNTGTYDTYSGADDSHQFVSDNASHSTLWVTNTNTSYATSMFRLESARVASSAFNFLAATTGNLTDDQFLLRGDGNAYADGSWNGGGADYAEYFEWSDGNTANEDRRGYTVVLSENKIRKSTSEDNPNNIIGVVSGNPSVIGDSDIGAWKNKYQKDDYGSYIKDANGNRVINDEYDETQNYISREDRQEWDIIGLMGKVRINKGQTVGDRWIKMRDISDTIEEWLIK